MAYREWTAFEHLAGAGTPASAREAGHLNFERVNDTTTRIELRFDSESGMVNLNSGIPSPCAVTLERFVAFLDEHSWPTPPDLLRVQEQGTSASA
jgi:hypothetical protein